MHSLWQQKQLIWNDNSKSNKTIENKTKTAIKNIKKLDQISLISLLTENIDDHNHIEIHLLLVSQLVQ